jgi:hypothetical protein
MRLAAVLLAIMSTFPTASCLAADKAACSGAIDHKILPDWLAKLDTEKNILKMVMDRLMTSTISSRKFKYGDFNRAATAGYIASDLIRYVRFRSDEARDIFHKRVTEILEPYSVEQDAHDEKFVQGADNTWLAPEYHELRKRYAVQIVTWIGELTERLPPKAPSGYFQSFINRILSVPEDE